MQSLDSNENFVENAPDLLFVQNFESDYLQQIILGVVRHDVDSFLILKSLNELDSVW